MTEDILHTIKARGYWRINFQPIVAMEKLQTFKDCKEIVERNTVRLRSWDYPYFPKTGKGCGNGNNYFFTELNWEGIVEYWRMYKSGQFIHYLALREDWFEEDSWMDKARAATIKNTLGIIGGCTYQLTEIFEFLSRLTRAGLYDEGVRVNIILHNMKGRKLAIEDQLRAPFHYDRVCHSESIVVMEEVLEKERVMNESIGLTVQSILKTFDHFDWYPTEDIIKTEVEDYLSGKR